MSKYNFRIDEIDPNSTHGKVLMKVKHGGDVLEFGCASGYMTKYMHEKMGCNVDIVEKNHNDFTKACQYARNSYSGDIDEFGWFGTFRKNQYDTILFADVLEHLMNPMKVMEWAAKLLKDDGKMIISIPNICHNDIILRMWNDCFTYTDIGLLDSSHVHFWGIRDFIMQCENIGLHADECDCVIYPTGRTEQAMPEDAVDKRLMELLKDRELGEAYQFVFVVTKRTV